MENIIINGDLYVKITPTTVYRDIPLSKPKLTETEILDLLTKEIDVDILQNVLSNLSEIMEEQAKKGEIKREIIEDYEQNIGFYSIFVTEKSIFLISEYDATGNVICFNNTLEGDNLYEIFSNSMLPNNVLDYNNINDVKEDFISFYDFLKNASLIGHYLEPKTLNMPRYIILCEHLDTYLLQNIEDNSYLVVSKKYPGMTDYFIGRKCIDNIDKKNIYKDVFRQKTQNNRGGNSKIK